MALTVEKLLGDAHTLISRLKEQDCNADSIMSKSQVLHKRILAMKQVRHTGIFEGKLKMLVLALSALW